MKNTLFSPNLQFYPPPLRIQLGTKEKVDVELFRAVSQCKLSAPRKMNQHKNRAFDISAMDYQTAWSSMLVTPHSLYWIDYNGFLRQLTLFLKKTIPTFIEKPLWKIVWTDATRILLYQSQPYFHHFHNHKIHHHLHEVCNFLRWLAPCQC